MIFDKQISLGKDSEASGFLYLLLQGFEQIAEQARVDIYNIGALVACNIQQGELGMGSMLVDRVIVFFDSETVQSFVACALFVGGGVGGGLVFEGKLLLKRDSYEPLYLIIALSCIVAGYIIAPLFKAYIDGRENAIKIMKTSKDVEKEFEVSVKALEILRNEIDDAFSCSTKGGADNSNQTLGNEELMGRLDEALKAIKDQRKSIQDVIDKSMIENKDAHPLFEPVEERIKAPLLGFVEKLNTLEGSLVGTVGELEEQAKGELASMECLKGNIIDLSKELIQLKTTQEIEKAKDSLRNYECIYEKVKSRVVNGEFNFKARLRNLKYILYFIIPQKTEVLKTLKKLEEIQVAFNEEWIQEKVTELLDSEKKIERSINYLIKAVVSEEKHVRKNQKLVDIDREVRSEMNDVTSLFYRMFIRSDETLSPWLQGICAEDNGRFKEFTEIFSRYSSQAKSKVKSVDKKFDEHLKAFKAFKTELDNLARVLNDKIKHFKSLKKLHEAFAEGGGEKDNQIKEITGKIKSYEQELQRLSSHPASKPLQILVDDAQKQVLDAQKRNQTLQLFEELTEQTRVLKEEIDEWELKDSQSYLKRGFLESLDVVKKRWKQRRSAIWQEAGRILKENDYDLFYKEKVAGLGTKPLLDRINSMQRSPAAGVSYGKASSVFASWL